MWASIYDVQHKVLTDEIKTTGWMIVNDKYPVKVAVMEMVSTALVTNKNIMFSIPEHPNEKSVIKITYICDGISDR